MQRNLKRCLRSGLLLIVLVYLPKPSEAEIRDFKLEAFLLQKVGEAFPLYVKDGVDELGNPASGTVQVRIKAGDGLSPDSFPPILNPIVVNNGTGLAYQVLTNVAPTIFEGVADTVVRTSNTIFVTAGPLHHFSLSVNSPQTSGQPFAAPSFLTAKDMYGNPVVNFDAATDSVAITASDSGKMSNQVFKTTQDFILGVADLTLKQTTYTGRGGFLIFQAQSSSGKSGLSNTILVRSLRIESVNVSPGSVSRGDTLSVTVQVFNTADISGTVTDIDLDFSLGDLAFEILNTSLPHTISVNSSFYFQLKAVIPPDYSAGNCQVFCQMAGSFGSFVIQDSLSEAGSFQVTGGVSLEYVQNSLYPQVQVLGQFSPVFSLRLSYITPSLSAIDTTSYISMPDAEGNLIVSHLRTNAILAPPEGTVNLYFLPRIKLPVPVLEPGKYPLTLVIHGLEDGNLPFSDSILLPDSVELREVVLLEYIAGSLEPDTVTAGDTVSFSFQVKNPTDSIITIYPSSYARFIEPNIKGGFGANLESDSLSSAINVHPGIQRLFCQEIPLTRRIIWGLYDFRAHIDYVIAPYLSYSKELNTLGEQLYVKPPANLQKLIVELFPLAEQFIQRSHSLPLLKLVISNQDPNTFHYIVLNGFTLGFGGVPAHELLSGYSAEVTTRNWSIEYPSAIGDKAVIEFPEPLILSPYQEDTIVFYATFNPEANTNSFVLTLDASDFQPHDYFGGQTGVPVPVTSPSGEVLNYQSPVFTLLSGSFKQSASVFPNPFNPDNQLATIIYNANPPAQVSFDIFTLTGEKVLSLQNPESASQFLWDGKNEVGDRVLSGVYLGLLKNHQSGEEVRLRIGVVR